MNAFTARALPEEAAELRAATPADIPALEHFIAAYTGDGTLLPRTRANLLGHLGDFVLAVAGGELLGCGALQRVDTGLAEVRTVAVRPEYRGNGIGGRIVDALVERARQEGLHAVFCLTRRVPFFAHHGFRVTATEKFPQKIWNDCLLCPRRECCDETAMELELNPEASS